MMRDERHLINFNQIQGQSQPLTSRMHVLIFTYLRSMTGLTGIVPVWLDFTFHSGENVRLKEK